MIKVKRIENNLGQNSDIEIDLLRFKGKKSYNHTIIQYDNQVKWKMSVYDRCSNLLKMK